MPLIPKNYRLSWCPSVQRAATIFKVCFRVRGMRAARSLPADGWVAPGAVAAASSLSQDSGLLLSLSHPEGESTIRVHSSALLTFPDVQVLSCRPTGRMNVPEGGAGGCGAGWQPQTVSLPSSRCRGSLFIHVPFRRGQWEFPPFCRSALVPSQAVR